MDRMHVWVSGKVQGVFFRESTRRQAEALGVQGWVRNLPDGRVEAVFEGQEMAVESMLVWCHRGPPSAEVARVESQGEPATGEFQGFAVLREGRIA